MYNSVNYNFTQYAYCHKSGVGCNFKGFSPCVESVECLNDVSANCVHIHYMHSKGPYGNLRDRSVANFIGSPLLAYCNCHKLEEHLFVDKANESLNLKSRITRCAPKKVVPTNFSESVISVRTESCGGDHGGRVVTLSPPTSEVGGSIPVTALSGKAGSCLPLVGSLQYTTLANSMYWFPLPFQLPVVI